MADDFASRLRARESVTGCWLSIGHPASAELLAGLLDEYRPAVEPVARVGQDLKGQPAGRPRLEVFEQLAGFVGGRLQAVEPLLVVHT